MVRCSVKCCPSESRTDKISFFSFPRDANLRSKWVELINRSQDRNWTWKTTKRVCALHFRKEDIETMYAYPKLKKDVLPSQALGKTTKLMESRDLVMTDDEVVVLEENSFPVSSETENLTGTRSKMVFFEYEGVSSEEEYYDGKNFEPLVPLVQYVFDEREVSNMNLENDCEDYRVDDGVETIILDTEVCSENEILNKEELLEESLEASEAEVLELRPEMFNHFLKSDEENKEVGETIILQFEENEQQEVNETTPDMTWFCNQPATLCSSKDGSVLNTYTCEICDYSYGCLNCLKSHYKTEHVFSMKIIRYKCRYSYANKNLICPVCEMIFKNKMEMTEHHITHSVICDICGSGFVRQLNLVEHRKFVHNKDHFGAFYNCELCKAVYQFGSSLTKHYQEIHKLILCCLCLTKFETVKDLLDHEKLHVANVLPYACSKCDKAFANISDIPVHIRQDHSDMIVKRPELRITAKEKPPKKKLKYIY